VTVCTDPISNVKGTVTGVVTQARGGEVADKPAGRCCSPCSDPDLPMPFKANAVRGRHIPKQKRKVTNWVAYDASIALRRMRSGGEWAEGAGHRDYRKAGTVAGCAGRGVPRFECLIRRSLAV